MPEYSAREALLWQLIAKNRKRRLALHTALRTVSVSETTATTPSGMLDRAFVSKQQWSSGLESVLPSLPTQCYLVKPSYGPLTARTETV